jgi:hypothetical protein
MEIILHRHLVAMEKFVARRRHECHPRVGRPLLSCIFSGFINDAAITASDMRPRYHFRLSSFL